MRILIACEESQAITCELRNLGHESFSCDIQECSGPLPQYHIKGDCIAVIKSRPWDMIIMHPPCTALSLSGNRWYGKGMPRHNERLEAIEWTVDLWKLATSVCDKVALENPTSVIFKYLNAPVQYIQPWQFGHGECKKTGFALHGLPKLAPTEIVDGREQRIWKMPPSPDRRKERSKTFKGIACAIAKQWGS